MFSLIIEFIGGVLVGFLGLCLYLGEWESEKQRQSNKRNKRIYRWVHSRKSKSYNGRGKRLWRRLSSDYQGYRKYSGSIRRIA